MDMHNGKDYTQNYDLIVRDMEREKRLWYELAGSL